MFGNARKHAWTDFVTLVEGEHIVGPAKPLKGAVRPVPSLDPPSDAKQRA
jgi:hypothetical protein